VVGDRALQVALRQPMMMTIPSLPSSVLVVVVNNALIIFQTSGYAGPFSLSLSFYPSGREGG
jgi:hypothetical protein